MRELLCSNHPFCSSDSTCFLRNDFGMLNFFIGYPLGMDGLGIFKYGHRISCHFSVSLKRWAGTVQLTSPTVPVSVVKCSAPWTTHCGLQGLPTHCQVQTVCKTQLTLVLEKDLFKHFRLQPTYQLIANRESMRNYLQFWELRAAVGFFVWLFVYFL